MGRAARFAGLFLLIGVVPLSSAEVPCTSLSSLQERALCEWVSSDMEDDLEIEYFSWRSNRPIQTELSDSPKLLIRSGALSRAQFITIPDIPFGRVVVDVEKNSRVKMLQASLPEQQPGETRIHIQKRGAPDNTMMMLLLPKRRFGNTSDIVAQQNNATDAPSDHSAGSPNYLIIGPTVGGLVHLFGWALSAMDIWDSFYDTAETRRLHRQQHPGWSLTMYVGAILSLGGGAILRVAIRRCRGE